MLSTGAVPLPRLSEVPARMAPAAAEHKPGLVAAMRERVMDTRAFPDQDAQKIGLPNAARAASLPCRSLGHLHPPRKGQGWVIQIIHSTAGHGTGVSHCTVQARDGKHP